MSTAPTLDPYWSRLADRWEAADRQDPTLWPGHTGPLSNDELQAYAEQGFRYSPGLFSSDEVVSWRTEAERLIAALEGTKRGVIREPRSNAVRSIFRIHRISPIFQRVCADLRISDIARQMLGSDVYLHQSRINFKPGFDGREFFWHSDFETWHVEDGMPRMRAVSVSISLTENTEFNGPLMVVPGSHKTFIRCQGETPENHFEQSLKQQEYGVPSREALEMLIERHEGLHAVKGPAGSALFFECNLMHGSAGNLSPYPRTNLFFVFNSVENAVQDPYGQQPPRPEYLAERDVIPVGDLSEHTELYV
ncbi:MAG: ectoine hydroxylase [Pirellulaceae bacterium]|nr:ectoine hydroxylase [Planctomycetales bacterium]